MLLKLYNSSGVTECEFLTFALFQQRCDDGFVLYRVERAGGVHHPASHRQLFNTTHRNTQLEPGEHIHTFFLAAKELYSLVI